MIEKNYPDWAYGGLKFENDLAQFAVDTSVIDAMVKKAFDTKEQAFEDSVVKALREKGYTVTKND